MHTDRQTSVNIAVTYNTQTDRQTDRQMSVNIADTYNTTAVTTAALFHSLNHSQ